MCGVTALALAAAFSYRHERREAAAERDKGRWQAAAYDAARTDAGYGLARNLRPAFSDQAAPFVARAASGGQPARTEAT